MNLSRFLNFDFSPLFWIVFATILFFFIVQLFYYLLIYKKPYSYERKRNKDAGFLQNAPSISVVIASKNESENLEKNLPGILEQNYPNFEVIVVNMGSTDETDIVLKRLNLKYSNLYHTYVPAEAENMNEKKLALTIGIKAAKNDILLFTEAYCAPTSQMWIQEFANEFLKSKDIVLGFCKLLISSKVPLRRFMFYDNLIQHLKFLSMAIIGKPFMGINRNLAYRKNIFFEEKGFSSVLSVEDGEDDLFINKIVKNRKVGVVVSPESVVQSDVVRNFYTWRALKSKYLYTKQFYRGTSNFVFWFETLSKYCFYFSSIFGISYGVANENWPLVVICSIFLIIRFFIQLSIINKYDRMFGSGKFNINLLLYDLFQPFNNFKFRRYIKRRNHYRK